jgi:MerR family Zn(II)-responsive transcriptional regulator of zntA
MALTVTQLARSAGIAPPTVRYYDRIGLLRPQARSDSGYRLYSPSDESRLRFIRRAKLLGLSLDEIRELLVAAEDGCGSTLPELDRMLDNKLREIDATIAELEALRERLVAYRAGKRVETAPACRCGQGDFCGCLDDVPDP